MPYYYVLNPAEGDTSRETTMTEAMARGEQFIEVYRGEADDGWSEDVQDIAVYKCDRTSENPINEGIMVARSSRIVLEERPDDVDEDGYSASDDSTWWGDDFTAICDYKMEELKPTD